MTGAFGRFACFTHFTEMPTLPAGDRTRIARLVENFSLPKSGVNEPVPFPHERPAPAFELVVRRAADLSVFIGDAEEKMVGLIAEAARERHASLRGVAMRNDAPGGISEGCSLDHRRAYLIWEAAHEAADDAGWEGMPHPCPLQSRERKPRTTLSIPRSPMATRPTLVKR